MRIDKWPLDRIMCLPDWCFGRRWSVSCEVLAYGEASAFDISEVGLPDQGVLWQFIWEPMDVGAPSAYCRIAFGDHLAATEAEFMLFEPVLHGFGSQGPGPRAITDYQYGGSISVNLRQPIEPQGRRLCMMGVSVGQNAAEARCILVVSSLPKEIPDWLTSAKAINLI